MYYRVKIANAYCMGLRTFNKHAKDSGLVTALPKIAQPKALIYEKDMKLVIAYMGLPTKKIEWN